MLVCVYFLHFSASASFYPPLHLIVQGLHVHVYLTFCRFASSMNTLSTHTAMPTAIAMVFTVCAKPHPQSPLSSFNFFHTYM